MLISDRFCNGQCRGKMETGGEDGMELRVIMGW